MTTNNHPAHGPVLLDRLHQIREILSKAAAQSDGSNLGYAMADAVKVINGVIAIPETIPCPVRLEPGLKFGKGVRTQCVLDALRRRDDYYAELEAMTPEQREYHDAGITEFKAMLGTPAPVVPDEYRHLSELYHAQEKRLFKLAQRIKGPSFDKYAYSPSQAIDVLEEVIFGEGDDSYRAVMQSFGNSEKLDEIGSWNNHRNTSTAQAGNSPVTPDGWQLVPKEPTAAMNKAGWNAMNEYDAINPTYIAMLAAAPQQEDL